MSLITLLIYILILGLIFGLVYWIIGQVPLPEPFGMIARVIVGVIFIIVLLSMVFGGIHMPTLGGVR